MLEWRYNTKVDLHEILGHHINEEPYFVVGYDMVYYGK
jgi:hypothetical protein